MTLSDRNFTKKIDVFDIFITGFFVIILIILVVPFWSVLMSSLVNFKTLSESGGGIILFPKSIDFSAYVFLFSTNEITRSLLVTVFITVVGVSYNLFLSVSLAYGISFKEFPGKKIVITYVLIPFFFTGGLIPFYLLIKELGLVDSIFAMILPTGINIWYLIIMKNFFSEIPSSLREAAIIDGANDVRILLQIILPVSKAMIFTFFLFYSVERWNEWFMAMLFINDAAKVPMQKFLRDIIFNTFSAGNMAAAYKQTSSSYVASSAIKMATAIVTIAPILFVYPFLQKYFVKGVMAGAVKG